MAIQWNYMEAPTGATSLEALNTGNDAIVKGISSLAGIANTVNQEGIKRNTDTLANILSQARNPVELESAMIQMQQAAQGMNGRYDQGAIRTLQNTRPTEVANLLTLDQNFKDQDAVRRIATALAANDPTAAQSSVSSVLNPTTAVDLAVKTLAQVNTNTTNTQTATRDANANAVALATLTQKADEAAAKPTGGTGGGSGTYKVGDIEFNANDGSLKVGQKPSQDQTAINSYKVNGGKMETTPTVLKVANWGNTPADAYSYYVDRIKGTKSPEGTGQNPESTANGVGQLLDKTFINTVAAHRPELMVGRTPDQVVALKNDPTIATQMFELHTADNAAALTKAGIPVTPTTLDGMHWFGEPTFKQLWNINQNNPNTPLSSVLSEEILKPNYLTDERRSKQKKPLVKTVGDLFGMIESERLGLTTKSAIDRNIPAEVIEGIRGDFALSEQSIRSDYAASELARRTPNFEAQQKLADFLDKGSDSSFGIPWTNGSKQLLALAQGVSGFNELGDSEKATVLQRLESYNKNNEGLGFVDVGETTLKKVALETITAMNKGRINKLDTQLVSKLLEYKIKLATTTRNYGVTSWSDSDVVNLLMPEASKKDKEHYVDLMKGEGKSQTTDANNPFGTGSSSSPVSDTIAQLAKGKAALYAKTDAEVAKPTPTINYDKPSIREQAAQSELLKFLGIVRTKKATDPNRLRPIPMPTPTITYDKPSIREQAAQSELLKFLGIVVSKDAEVAKATDPNRLRPIPMPTPTITYDMPTFRQQIAETEVLKQLGIKGIK